MDIAAIPTRFKGYHFRSRSEARFAVFMDHCGIDWRYEMEGLDLGEHGLYLPDFFIPHGRYNTPKFGLWMEIKPTPEPESEVLRWKAAVKATKIPLLAFNAHYDKPYCMRIGHDFKGTGRNLGTYSKFPCGSDYDTRVAYFYMWLVATLGGDTDKCLSAIDAAKSARFEHGESGAT